MTLYTSDIDDIYSGILDGTINSKTVRIISSNNPQSLKLLKDFPNVEEILCPIVCPINNLTTIGSLITSCHQLKIISLVLYISEAEKERSETPPPNKRRRITQLTAYQRSLRVIIPDIIRKLGSRMRYITLNMIILDVTSNDCTTILLSEGTFYANSNNLNNHNTSNIFYALNETRSLKGISTDGNIRYDLSEIDIIPEVTIFAKGGTASANDEFITTKYLTELVSKAEIVTIHYDSKTIDERYSYSDIIRFGTSGFLKRIKGIVPAVDVKDHIRYNKNLEEIHVLVRNVDDIEDMKYVMNKYYNRAISYYIHYAKGIKDDYWVCLKDYGDVIFEDIVRTLMVTT